jgi:Rad3-related DNA helicase
VVFTSATLTVDGSPEYLLPRLGLTGELGPRTSTEVYPGPFEGRQMYAAAIAPSPDPDKPEYAAFAAETIAGLVKELGRNVLVLFTANALLRSVYSLLLASRGVEKSKLFAQNITGNRHVILEQFRRLRGAVLLGADSFWEGIDAPGEACEIVVMTRLPFPVPTHPLTQAIAKRYEERQGESFYSYSIPEAVIRFRQGAGRLIRTQTDRGVLVVLDNRIVTRGYGKAFARSLPSPLRRHASVREAIDAARDFFAGAEPRAVGPEEEFDWGA